MTRPELPGLLGHDANAISADRHRYLSPHRGELYDPDPYADTPWFPHLVYAALSCEGSGFGDPAGGLEGPPPPAGCRPPVRSGRSEPRVIGLWRWLVWLTRHVLAI